MKIDDIRLEIINDSRGQNTLETTIKAGEFEAFASVPSGKSTGAAEAAVLPPDLALKKIPWLLLQLKGHQFASLEQFDSLLIALDGTSDKSNLGGNLMLALSMAFARILAKIGNMELFEFLAKISGTKELKLPFCFFNLIEGGVHVDSTLSEVEGLPFNLPFQEYLLIPQTNSPKKSLGTVRKAIDLLREKVQGKYGSADQGDEGGFSLPSNDPQEGFRVLQEVINENSLNGKIGLDAAASTFYQNGSYNIGGKIMSRDDLVSFYQLLPNNYQLLSLEDVFDQEDWDGFSKIMQLIGNKVWIIGDDLLTTNISRIKKAQEINAANAIIIKPNQIGTITETIQAANLAKSFGWKIIVSHRSGETMDSFIADLAVGLGADGLKSGCPLQKERLVKYERLVEIEKKSKLKN
ncbi:hypothetical protein HY384_03270 [Candidatus Daviesbacteria bacterium]|nr:hypothetical protein [Candidatus Daviesbacteria bacterium]